ncbi:MAG: periplasmic heavy metal sensor [Thermodesulfobacteriota bacterium]
MSKGLKIFLALSVLLNVLLIGILIGTLSHTFFWHMEKGKRAFHFMKELPPEKREKVMETIKDLRKESLETRKKIKKKRDEVIDVFSAPEFDPALFDRKVTELHALMGELTDEIADETKKIASDLTREERKAIADIIRRGPGPPFPRFFMEGFHGGKNDVHGEKFHMERFDGPPPPPPPPDWEEPPDGPGGEPHDEPL